MERRAYKYGRKQEKERLTVNDEAADGHYNTNAGIMCGSDYCNPFCMHGRIR